MFFFVFYHVSFKTLQYVSSMVEVPKLNTSNVVSVTIQYLNMNMFQAIVSLEKTLKANVPTIDR